MASEFCEITVSRHERSALKFGQRRSETIYVWDFVSGLEFSCPQGLGQVHGQDADGQARKIVDGLSGGLVPVALP